MFLLSYAGEAAGLAENRYQIVARSKVVKTRSVDFANDSHRTRSSNRPSQSVGIVSRTAPRHEYGIPRSQLNVLLCVALNKQRPEVHVDLLPPPLGQPDTQYVG